MTVGCWELNKVVAPHSCICAQHFHHLRYLGPSPRSVSCCVEFSKCVFFFQYTPGYWVTRLICLHVGEGIMDLSNASPGLPSQPHNISGMVPQDLSVLLSHISKMGPLYWWYRTNMRTVSTAGHCRLCWTICEGKDRQWTHKKIQGPGIAVKFWGVIGWIRPRLSKKLYLVSCKPIQPLRKGKRYQLL